MNLRKLLTVSALAAALGAWAAAPTPLSVEAGAHHPVLSPDGATVLYAVEDLELAYCISVHKSQGSEFPVVVLPAVGGPPMLLTRNLFYTAVTRARRMVMLVGREDAIDQMIRNAYVTRRYSALGQRLSVLHAL